MQNHLTLGSLFDGSGGFPLGGLLAGITPVWASEIEPFPIRVTTKRLPFMKHYGDISRMDGGKIEPVDIITFGSPCTDMSCCGKRAGLNGSQSRLFYQAIRIIKEMRCATNGKYPRYIVWENVPGAFSSNQGEDFRCVLESVCKIKDEENAVPRPEKWQSAGEILADGFSLAWRVLDAQYWGVPQRRKRIYLVADFAGGSAGKILFESEGLSGYSAQGFRSWQGTAGDATDCTGTAGRICLNDQGGNRMDVSDDIIATLRAEAHHPPCVLEAAGFCTEHSAKARGIGYGEETSPTLRAGTVPAAVALENHPADSRVKVSGDGNVQTLTSRMGTGGNNVPLVMKCGGQPVPFCKGTRPHSAEEAPDWKDGRVANTLNTFDRGESRCSELVVQASGVCSKETRYTVRRLTPTECARLQGFPDWWCSGLGTENPTDEEMTFWREVFETRRRVMGTSSRPKTDAQIRKWLKAPHSDSAEYTMWGNGVALPCVRFVLTGIVWAAQNCDKSSGETLCRLLS